MILTFVLASGSIKELAKTYGVSYPTMRSRLDQLIERVRKAVEAQQPDPMNSLLADLIQKGELNPSSAQRIQELHRHLRKEQPDP